MNMDLENLIRNKYTFLVAEEIINFLQSHQCLDFLQRNMSNEIKALEFEVAEWECKAESQEELAINYKDKCKDLQEEIKKLKGEK